MSRVLAIFALSLAATLAGRAQQPRVIVMHLDDTIQPISADYLARGLDVAVAQHAERLGELGSSGHQD